MRLLDMLKDPGPEFSPIPFWFLNGDLTHKELRRQLADFHAHGVDGVVLHPRMGLPRRIGYLSDEFFAYIRTALETCRELGMRVVFYDEGMYPSGSACGQVAAGRPEYASLGITVTEAPEAGDEVLAEKDGAFLAARHTRGTIRGVHYGEDDFEPNAPLSADLLNPDAVARFIELTHEAYWRRFKEYFGSTVIGFFTDEPSVTGRCVTGMKPWTRGFAKLFTDAGGELRNLFALFTGEENDDTRLYERMIMERENEVYYSALSSWCREHGIALMGHPDSSDDIERERHFHIPGQDLVYRQVSPEKGDLTGRDSVQGKCSADAARLLGRRRNSNECLGVCGGEENPWSMTAADIKWFIDYLAVRGVNMYILHAFYYSILGRRRDERPPDVGPHSIWWPHYRRWTDYVRRVSCLMTDTELRAPVAVLCRNRELMPEAVAPLFENQIGFMYLPQSFWDGCRVEAGRLVCGQLRFSAVIDPEGRFPQVSRDVLAQERDIRTARPQPGLRAIRFGKGGTECVFLANAGETDIDTPAALPFGGKAGQYDLWSGKAARFEERLILPRRGSLLLFACSEAEFDGLPALRAPAALPVPAFRLVSHDPAAAVKVYEAETGPGEGVLTLEAEEMAELTVNGVFAGVSFWGPHRFDLTGLLTAGQNKLRLTVTGSRANLYGKPVPYGLK